MPSALAAAQAASGVSACLKLWDLASASGRLCRITAATMAFKSVSGSSNSVPLESARASVSRDSVSWVMRSDSCRMSASDLRYSSGVRSRRNANSAVARISVSGVRNSCEASAVNF